MYLQHWTEQSLTGSTGSLHFLPWHQQNLLCRLSFQPYQAVPAHKILNHHFKENHFQVFLQFFCVQHFHKKRKISNFKQLKKALCYFDIQYNSTFILKLTFALIKLSGGFTSQHEAQCGRGWRFKTHSMLFSAASCVFNQSFPLPACIVN